jgi:hypothetical protein
MCFALRCSHVSAHALVLVISVVAELLLACTALTPSVPVLPAIAVESDAAIDHLCTSYLQEHSYLCDLH